MGKKEQAILIPQDGECIESKFGKENIRRQFHQNEWWFAVSDVINTLIDVEVER